MKDILSEIRIGDKVTNVITGRLLGFVIGVNADGTHRVAADAKTAVGAVNFNFNTGGFELAVTH